MPQRQVVKNIDGVTHMVTKKSSFYRLRRRFNRNKWAPLILLTLAIVVAGVVLLVTNLGQGYTGDKNAQLKSAVAKHVILPDDEEPLIATVTDKDALKTPFLQEADNGDRILIYEKAKRVIIYRPSVDRIVNIGPVELANIPNVDKQ